MKFEKHIFICTNQRAEGLGCCGQENGMKLVETFKAELKKVGLHTKVRAQRAGCIDVCKNGPALVVYPDGVFYGNVSESDVEKIVQSHIVNNVVVEELKINF